MAIQTDSELIATILKLYEGASEYTHSNVGEEQHRTAYQKLDSAVHDIALWVGEDGLEEFLRGR